MFERHEIEKLKSRIDGLPMNKKIELLKYLYNITKNDTSNIDLINGTNSIKLLLKNRSFLLDNFNGNDVKDFEVYFASEKIKFRLVKKNIVLGVDSKGVFLIGTITDNMELYLIKFDLYWENPESLIGTINNSIFTGKLSSDNTNETVNTILLNNDSNLYDKIPNKKIEGLTLLLRESYDKLPDKFKKIVQTIINKDKSKNPIMDETYTKKLK